MEDSTKPTSDKIIKQYLVPPYPVSGVTADYDRDCEMIAAAQDAGKKVCAQYPYTFHYGIDLAGRNSTTDGSVLRNIKASGYGKVVSIRKDDETYPLGSTVLVKYPNAVYGSGISKHDIYFLYCHLEKISVAVNQEVTAETVIGVAGQTGTGATENHLHLEAYTSQITQSKSEVSSVTTNVDPISYFFNSNADDSVGLRTIVPDSAAPFYRDEYCDGIGGCTHTERLYYYNTDKIYGRGDFAEPTY